MLPSDPSLDMMEVSFLTPLGWAGFLVFLIIQADHSPDNVKFPDGSWHSSTALGMLSVTHIMTVLVLLSVVGVGMQQYMILNHILSI